MRAPVVSPLHKTVPLFAVAILMLGLVPMLGVQAAAMAEEAEGSEGAGDAVALASELSSSGEGEPAGDVDAEGADVGAVALVGASQLSREVALQPLSEDGSGVLLLADALAGKPTCFVNQEVALDSNASVLGSFIVDGMTYAVTGEGAVELVAVGPAALAGDLLAGLAEAVPVGSDGVLSGEGSGSGVPTSPSPSPEGASSDDAEGDPASGPAILEVPESVEHDGATYSVTSIGPRAFAGCDADVVTIPAAVESVDELAFRGSAVASVEVAGGNPQYSSYDGMLFDADQTSLLLIPEGKQGAARIPKTASSVPPDALSHCVSVTSVEVEAGSAAYYSENGCLYDAEGGALALSPSAGAGAGSPLAGSMGLARVSSASFAPVTFDGNGCYMSLVRMYNHQSETFETVKGYEKLSSFTLSPGMVVNGEGIFDPDCSKELAGWGAGWWSGVDQWNYGLHAYPKQGYEFAGWDGSDGTWVGPNGRNFPFEPGVTYAARWAAKKAILALDANGGTFGPGKTELDVTFDSPIDTTGIALARRTAYDLTGYALDKEGTQPVMNYKDGKYFGICADKNTIYEDKTALAQWKPTEYDISYDLKGGSWDGSAAKGTYDCETHYDLPAPKRIGYTFAGWDCSGASLLKNPDGSNVATAGFHVRAGDYYPGNPIASKAWVGKGTYGNLKVAAKWAKNQAQVRVNGDGVMMRDGRGANSGLDFHRTVPTDERVEANSGFIANTVGWGGSTMVYGPKHDCLIHYIGSDGNLYYVKAWRTGYRQTGWKATDSKGAVTMVSNASNPDGVPMRPMGDGDGPDGIWQWWAQWEPIEYEIVYDLGGGTNAASNKGAYTCEEQIDLAAPTRAGWSFAGWEVEGASCLKGADGKDLEGAGFQASEAEACEGAPFAKRSWIGKGTCGDLKLTAKWRLNQAVLRANDPTDPGNDWRGRVRYYLTDGDGRGELASETQSNTMNWTGATMIYSPRASSFGNPLGVCPVQYVASGRLWQVEAVRPGYDQVGWYAVGAQGERVEISATVSPAGLPVQPSGDGSRDNGDWEYYAMWEPHAYRISYDLGGGANHPGNPSSYTAFDEGFDLKAPTRAGWTFAGWTWEGGGALADLDGEVLAPGGGVSEAWGSDPFAKVATVNEGTMGDMTVKASWRRSMATLRSNGEGRAADGKGIGSWLDYYVQVEGAWVRDEASSGYFANSVAWDGGTMLYGSSVRYAAHFWTGSGTGRRLRKVEAVRPGYEQVGWSLDQAGEQMVVSPEVEPGGVPLQPMGNGPDGAGPGADRAWEYWAQWEAHRYRVAFDPAGGAWDDAGAGEAVSAAFDQDVTLAAAPKRSGYLFAGWEATGPDGAAYSFDAGATLAGGKLKGAEGDVAAVPISYGERAVEGQEPATTATFTAKWVADLRVDVPIAVDLDLTVDWEQGRVVASGPDGSEHATGEFRSWSSGEVQVAAFGQEAATAMGHRQSALGLFASGDEAKAGNLMKVSLVLSADADGAQALSFPLSGLYELPADPPHDAMASPQDLSSLDLVVPPASSAASPGTLHVRYGIDCAADLPLSDVAIDERPRPILKLVYLVGLA